MKLIDKDALVAEIEKLMGNPELIEDWRYRVKMEEKNELLKSIINIIDTLEVKEVDLMMHTIIVEGCDWLTMNTNLSHNKIEDCRNLMLTVKEELGLKAQKGE